MIKQVLKELITMQDIAQGVGNVIQTRGGKSYLLGKVDLPYSVESLADLKKVDVDTFNSARVFNTPASFKEYYYDPVNKTGIRPDVGNGSWRERTSASLGNEEGPEGPEGPSGDTIQVYLDVSNGVFFKNNTGANKTVTAEVYLNGEKLVDTSSLIYRWLVEDVTAYVDSGANYVSTTPSTGLFPADGDMQNGINTRSVIFDPSDVDDGRGLKIVCEISNL